MLEKNLIYDCIVIGGGPGGLTAGIYLSRFLLKILVLHDHKSRTRKIPVSYNLSGFPDGLSGMELLDRLKTQYLQYHQSLIKDSVLSLGRTNDVFTVTTSQSQYQAKKIILATGSEDITPDLHIPHEVIEKGLVRQCPVCDAYEMQNKRIAILGEGNHALKEAIFMRDYSPYITVFLYPTQEGLDIGLLEYSENLGIVIHIGEVNQMKMDNEQILIQQGACITQYDVIYTAFGLHRRTELAIKIGALNNKEKCLMVDSHQQTSIEGLYAIGDIVTGLNQIVVAMGQAAVAATAVRNSLKL